MTSRLGARARASAPGARPVTARDQWNTSARQDLADRAVSELGKPFKQRPFGALLRLFRHRMQASQNSLADANNMAPSYLNRLESGQRLPSRPIIVVLAAALHLSRPEQDQLLVGAGLCPQALVAVGWPPALALSAEVLGSLQMSPRKREEFATVVASVARQYLDKH